MVLQRFLPRHLSPAILETGINRLHRWNRQKIGAQLALNYTFDENNAIGIRYGYDKTPANTMNMILNTEVFQDYEPTESTYSPNLETDEDDTHQLNAYYTGKINNWNVDLNLDGYLE